MFWKALQTSVTAGLLTCVLWQASLVCAAVPKDAPKDIKYALGFYYGNGENILLRENKGQLELLYRVTNEDKCFARANSFPLTKVHFDSYILNENSPMNSGETSVKLLRDQEGYVISLRIGGHTYTRGFMGRSEGERGKVFALPKHTEEEWLKLKEQAKQAQIPEALKAGVQASLVNANSVPGLKVKSIYGQSENCFGAALYDSQELYLSKQAAEALTKVQQALQVRGYGLVLWDAYRPWSISKLATLALPEKSKDMLENPDTKGSTHNTGNAVDVGLYDLQTGESIEMISGFDEPSFRQYSSYPGGTTRLRYLRDVLRDTMELYGFTGIEMEWWHFEFDAKTKYAHLNIPFSEIK